MGRGFFVIRIVDGAINQQPWRQTLAAPRFRQPRRRTADRPAF